VNCRTLDLNETCCNSAINHSEEPRADVMSKETITVFTMNFWERFNLHDSFLGYLLQNAFGQFELADSEETADVVFTSVFMRSKPKFNYKTIWLIWENVRPNFDIANYAISSDFDDYGGRNVRCPLWYAELKWPGYDPPIVTNAANHGYEPPIELETISLERNPKNDDRREKFCCFVASHPEQHRMLAVELLSRIEKVDVYGNVVRFPLRQSKYTILPSYKFNICFENSMFPGYYTEKALQAWAGGCVPLYFADRFASLDFNPAAIINRADFPTLSDFVEHVRRINSSPDAVKEIVAQPLVLKKPSLDRIISFLKEAYTKIRRDTRPNFAINIPQPFSSSQHTGEQGFSKMKRNAPCFCGSGKKYKHCHGQIA
jgi:glycosyl transferase family 10 (putative fucosyltransferase)/alpha-1,3-fucosyltransferase FucT-like protein/SEC-C motif-containing protein